MAIIISGPTQKADGSFSRTSSTTDIVCPGEKREIHSVVTGLAAGVSSCKCETLTLDPHTSGGGVTCCLHVCLRICSSEACVSPAFFSTLNSPLAVFHSSGLRGKLLFSSPEEGEVGKVKLGQSSPRVQTKWECRRGI